MTKLPFWDVTWKSKLWITESVSKLLGHQKALSAKSSLFYNRVNMNEWLTNKMDIELLANISISGSDKFSYNYLTYRVRPKSFAKSPKDYWLKCIPSYIIGLKTKGPFSLWNANTCVLQLMIKHIRNWGFDNSNSYLIQISSYHNFIRRR